ncbi:MULTISPECIES: hypothetical protein [unclassified Pseudomonas]|uniref:hypothetical protein n=1 Tax=unclassified Pseudomonas TaxID=196821 RepID=UPI000BD05A62|nr:MULTISPECIES: hypothetical protein [unclassified Pseudomonas]PVZ20774.1 hypothetical protein F474_01379 [Pseudomonas sp. URIL14HWK12:I12]PVZ27840.1 hypothetical protein F470_01034 [Pseudomonas sp. URIL14HWK12:I10]PVZ38729.1 hypothetical protein F472_01379 [Pseudomonas sp. URIL14HWK12:I11]SNZ02236.1 hypothetical protein SAMN05660463_00025 [Pseudomonas sp. URIL14HWK12:I9]
MDIARCTDDNVCYLASRFALLPAEELEYKRRALICDSCGAEAYFRKASTSGQGACFGARPHGPLCQAAAADGAKSNASSEEQDILDNPGDLIELDLGYGRAGTGFHVPEHAQVPAPGAGGRYTGQGPRPAARMRRRLTPILRNLIYSEQFRNASQALEVPGHGVTTVRDFFVATADVHAGLEGQYRGFWGMIASVGPAKQEGSFWLNSRSYRDYSVLVSEALVDDLLRRARKREMDDLSGCHLLVLGELRRSGTGKLWVELVDMERCAVYDD